MAVPHTNEGQAGGLSVDILLQPQVVVEVDGPSHYCTTDTRRELGKTRFKRRLLTAQGVRCVSVLYFEWEALQSAAQRQEYLRQKLQVQALHALIDFVCMQPVSTEPPWPPSTLITSSTAMITS
jgi:very-short-patch-repair endonuclease